MSDSALGMSACAACAQSFKESILQIIFPSDDMLRVLQNNSLPNEVLPRTYALSAYNNAILCPLGMLDTHNLGVLHLCPSCTRALRSHPPRQPRDSLANFQYYGLSHASPFDIMLVSMCRASTITHHFSSESRRGGCVPEEAMQRFSCGNIAILPQEPCMLYSVCVVFSGGKYSPTQESLWLKHEGVRFIGESGVFHGIEIHHLPQGDNHDGMSDMDWAAGQSDMVVENVTYTEEDHSERSHNAMRARALAYAMDHKKFLVSKTGSSFVSDADPAMMTYLFPHLDPWGIGGFNNPACSPRQRISFERQVRNLLLQDTCFPFVCWNMIQKKEVSDNTSFAIPTQHCHSLINKLYSLSSTLTEVATKWNEIRSLIRLHGTLSLFVMLNPCDLSSMLDEWRSMSAYDRAVFMASHPDAAALAFHEQIKYNHGPGLFGICDAYYATVEEQGRGMLHCHILLWLKGNLNPERLRLAMNSCADFQNKMFAWLESIIKCEFPSTQSVCCFQVEKPMLDEEGDIVDPRLEFPPQIDKLDYETFKLEFHNFLEHVVSKCNWHEHTATCFKHLKPGEQGTDQNCRMRIDGSVRPTTFLDDEMQSIMLRQWHPRINNYNPIISFLLQCNMDIKYIGSGPATKALVYYSDLKVNVGLESLHTALRSHEDRFEGDQSSSTHSPDYPDL
ncbi:hypothetical protein BKA83DRAFT_4465681 [Pisolithus microcarpus]|nr:hypothetical protein BKA83DRAFT_4465681 [Pisolithus microcarpus]